MRLAQESVSLIFAFWIESHMYEAALISPSCEFQIGMTNGPSQDSSIVITSGIFPQDLISAAGYRSFTAVPDWLIAPPGQKIVDGIILIPGFFSCQLGDFF